MNERSEQNAGQTEYETRKANTPTHHADPWENLPDWAKSYWAVVARRVQAQPDAPDYIGITRDVSNA
jgi:hypothetical protein